LVAALEAPELGADERFSRRTGRIANYEVLNVELARRFVRQHDLAHWVERLGANDVPYAPIKSIDEVVHDPQVEHLGLIVPVESAQSGSRAVRPPVQFGGARDASVRAAPALDQHGAAIREAMARGESWPSLPAGNEGGGV
jgi:crotonobetainyl-CoA:carnitine CoA-transferase CaiB-like acyl-CoA transferase